MANTDASTAPMSKQPLRLGIIGCGGILRNIYSCILGNLTNQANVVGLCDLCETSLSRAGALFPAARCYSSIAQLLNEEKLDAVMVLSSETANARIAMEVLQAGIPVYLEKPPALTLKEYDCLREAEDRVNAPLFVAFNRRHAPLLQGIEWPNAPYRVEGRLERLDRDVPSFPYTALHILDSLLYFSQATPSAVDVEFTATPVATWQLTCRLGEANIAMLEIIPDGAVHCEYLTISAEDVIMEIQFPNPESDFPEGRITTTHKGRRKTYTGALGISAHEQMGYAPELRGFLQLVRAGQRAPESYRLSSCRSGIALMEAMADAFEAQASLLQ